MIRFSEKQYWMNKLLGDELTAHLQYALAAKIVFGSAQDSCRTEFAKHADEEYEHMNMLLEKMVEQNMHINTDLPSLIKDAGYKLMYGNTSEHLTKFLHEREEEAIVSYKNFLGLVGDTDPGLTQVLKKILNTELEHRLDLERIYSDVTNKRLDPTHNINALFSLKEVYNIGKKSEPKSVNFSMKTMSDFRTHDTTDYSKEAYNASAQDSSLQKMAQASRNMMIDIENRVKDAETKMSSPKNFPRHLDMTTARKLAEGNMENFSAQQSASKNIAEFDDAEDFSDWIKDAKPKAVFPEGTFMKSGEEIASIVRKYSKDKATAIKRINFYINRAGDNLKNKTEVMKAKKILEGDKE